VKFGDLTSVFFVHRHAWCFQSASERWEPPRAANLSALLLSSVTAGFLLAGIFCTQKNKWKKIKPVYKCVHVFLYPSSLWENRVGGKRNVAWKQRLKCCRWNKKKSKEKSAQTERQNKQLLKGFGSEQDCPLPPSPFEPGSACTGGGSQYQPHWDTGRHFCLTSCSDNPFS